MILLKSFALQALFFVKIIPFVSYYVQVHAQKSLFIGENGNALFDIRHIHMITRSCEFRVHRAGSQLKRVSTLHEQRKNKIFGMEDDIEFPLNTCVSLGSFKFH